MNRVWGVVRTFLMVLALMLPAACTPPQEPGLDDFPQVVGDLVVDYNERPHSALADEGRITTPIASIGDQLNTWHRDASESTRELWNWYNPVILNTRPDGSVAPDPDYLTDVHDEITKGHTVVRYRFVEQARFNDGTPIDWRSLDAVARACSPDATQYQCSRAGYDLIESVRPGATPNEAVVTFTTAYPWWSSLFHRVLHPAVAEDPQTFNTAYTADAPGGGIHPEWGAGPYRVESIDRATGTATFVPNEAWWGADRAVLDARTFRVDRAAQTLDSYFSGDFDAVLIDTRQQLQRAEDDRDTEVRRGLSARHHMLTLNATHGALADLRVREAIFAALDRPALSDIALQGLEHVEQLPGSLLLLPFQAGYRDNVAAVVTHDVAHANAVLDAAGWKPGPDGLRRRDGEVLHLEYVFATDSPHSAAMARGLRAMLADVGVDVALVESTPSEHADRVARGDFDLTLTRTRASAFGIARACRVWCGNAQANHSGLYPGPAEQILREQVPLESTKEAQTHVVNRAEEAGFAQYTILPLYNGPEIWAVRRGIANLGPDMFGDPRVQDVGWQR